MYSHSGTTRSLFFNEVQQLHSHEVYSREDKDSCIVVSNHRYARHTGESQVHTTYK